MKKLLAIIVLGLLFSGNANSKIIVLKKCDLGDYYEKFDYKIDTYKSRITEIRIRTEKFIEDIKKQRKKGQIDPSWSESKIQVSEFKMTYFDPPYAKGERSFVVNGENRKSEIDINLSDKKILNTMTYGDGSQFSANIQCN